MSTGAPFCAIPVVDLFLQLVARCQQRAVLRREIVDDGRKARPEFVGVDAGARNDLLDHEIDQLAIDVQA